MAISETKMQIVIANYFKDECDVNTSIRQAFEKGFRIGVKKGASMNRPQGEWIKHKNAEEICGTLISNYECSLCHEWQTLISNFCPSCGARMRGTRDEAN